VGGSPAAFHPDAALTVELDFTLTQKAKTTFSVDVMSSDGRLVFSSAFDGGELAGTGTAKVEVQRLGLGGGVYEVLASATANGEKVESPVRQALHVESTEGVGLVRPELRWSVSQ